MDGMAHCHWRRVLTGSGERKKVEAEGKRRIEGKLQKCEGGEYKREKRKVEEIEWGKMEE